MVILSIITRSSEHTVHFEHPLPKPNYIKLLSCSLFNSWDTLKSTGEISFFDAQDTAQVMTIPQGHYCIKNMARELQNAFNASGAKLTTEKNTPVGQLIISNPQAKKIVLGRDLALLLGVSRLPLRTVVEQLTIPTSYFIYCDLVDKNRNFFNGKPTSLLAKFDIRGKPFEKVHYQTPPHVSRDASSDEFVNSLTLSVKDLNSELFDFNGLLLEFEIEIN